LEPPFALTRISPVKKKEGGYHWCRVAIDDQARVKTLIKLLNEHLAKITNKSNVWTNFSLHNMIIETKKRGSIVILIVKPDYDDVMMERKLNTKLTRHDIKDIINYDCDVFCEDGRPLLSFRKNKLSKEKVETFYENVIKFAHNVTSNRGNATGSKHRNLYQNPRVMSNILGYFDKMSPSQKILLRKLRTPLTVSVRETRFLQEFPEKFKKMVPLIKEIDHWYHTLFPKEWAKQKKKANETPFHIEGTSFTTVTTNVNYQTTIHTDKGDDHEGFGNLSVIERGNYTGGETCFPQYGVGVDVRCGDVLFMDVHKPHANLPIVKIGSKEEQENVKRLSIVCYLRLNIWKQTRGKTRKFMERHNKTMKNLRAK
jgi:hypothetical protein